MTQFKYNLGDRAKDNISGFEGIIICRTEYINGCIRYGIQPQKLRDGKKIEADYVDESQLTILKPAAVKIAAKPTGGPAPTPQGLPNPK